MDADAREALDQLLMAAAPFVRRFPTARENDEAVRISRQPRQAIEPAKRIIEEGKRADIFELHTGNILDAAIAAAERGEGIQSEKSRSWVSATGRNIAFRLMLGFAVGGVTIAGEHFYEHSRTGAAIDKFVLDREADILDLTSGLPADVRAAVREVFRWLRERERNRPPVDPAERV